MYKVEADGSQLAIKWTCGNCMSDGQESGRSDTDARRHVAETGHRVTVLRTVQYQLRTPRISAATASR